MKKIFFILFCLFITIVQAKDFPKIKGYKQTSDVRIYTPDNLWEYINGAADQFLDYEFQLLRSCDLTKGDFSVSVDIYDLGTDLNAFGIYVNERPTNRERLTYGIEATISPPYQALLLKGSLYVKIDVLEGKIDEENGKQLLQAIADALDGSSEFPTELTVLPKVNMIPNSFQYANKAFLGLKELQKCMYADYIDADKNEFQYFVINTDSQKEVESIWQNISKKWQNKKKSGRQILLKKIPYQGIVAILRAKGKLYGIAGFEQTDKSINKLLEILD